MISGDDVLIKANEKSRFRPLLNSANRFTEA